MRRLENITERAVEVQVDMTDELDKVECILQMIKDAEEQDGVTPTPLDTLRAFNKDLWAVLVDKCEGEAMSMIKNASKRGGGVEALRIVRRRQVPEEVEDGRRSRRH